MKTHVMKPLYLINNFSQEELQFRSTLVVSILEDYVLMVDVCQCVNSLINISCSHVDSFWETENHVKGIQTLFLVCGIVREDHQQILEELINNIVYENIDGDKFERANLVKNYLFEKVRQLSKDL